ncbi:hypothetical protein HAX54_040348 [Datura stramonium]|uniref:Uncharacterized protein n=1 Tax=Datura stramonium TaxID=4076 RepID=A0ABS8SL30_DATST|nr:hypothetical protein [Datura stramonium]
MVNGGSGERENKGRGESDFGQRWWNDNGERGDGDGVRRRGRRLGVAMVAVFFSFFGVRGMGEGEGGSWKSLVTLLNATTTAGPLAGGDPHFPSLPNAQSSVMMNKEQTPVNYGGLFSNNAQDKPKIEPIPLRMAEFIDGASREVYNGDQQQNQRNSFMPRMLNNGKIVGSLEVWREIKNKKVDKVNDQEQAQVASTRTNINTHNKFSSLAVADDNMENGTEEGDKEDIRQRTGGAFSTTEASNTSKWGDRMEEVDRQEEEKVFEEQVQRLVSETVRLEG